MRRYQETEMDTVKLAVIQTLNKESGASYAWNERTSRAIVHRAVARGYGGWNKAPADVREYAEDVAHYITWGEALQMRLF